ncbi:MAG: methyltransferase domain-containing protein [Candidatus Aenigmarchaeota archaeon]|nr:methyltransferase domain-containing protein [Candidatus Aenigmarchaeota archaeon]
MIESELDWTKFWERKLSFRSFLFYRIYERFRARSYFRLLKDLSLKGKSILELGGGSGYICGLLCKKYGCRGTIIDDNKKAYEVFKRVVKNGDVNYILADMFDYKGRHDLVFSDGLIEHFHPKERREIILLHKKFVKDGGFLMFFVPKKSWLVEHFMSVKNGYEEKMSIKQLIKETSMPRMKLVSTEEDLHMVGVLYKVE